MMKHLFLLFLFVGPCLNAQKNKNEGKNFHWVSEQWAIGIGGGQFHPDFTNLNSQLISEGSRSGFYQGLRGYGISFVEPMNVSRNGLFDAAAAFNYLTPFKVSIGKNDSLNYKINGWNLLTSIYGKDLIPGKIVALVVAPGVDWGKLRMTRTLNGNGGLYKNFYIAPLARAELRFVFSFVALGARACYRYDITKDNWKQKTGPEFAMHGTKNTGTSIEFFVGWGRVHFQ